MSTRIGSLKLQPFTPPRRRRCRPRTRTPHASAASAGDAQADVCVLGAGIIGLVTSLALLRSDSRLRVALVDSAVPCSGATGAGQGYLWLAHRQPGSPAWQLAVRSRQLWQELLQSSPPELTPDAVEWQHTGSLLLARTEQESLDLQQRQQLLAGAGLPATYLTSAATQQAEPALQLPSEGSGLLLPSDAQLNGRAAAAAVQRACEGHGQRFSMFYHEPADQINPGPDGRVLVVQTVRRRLEVSLGVVIAMGAWSGTFLARQQQQQQQHSCGASQAAQGWSAAFKPRRGVLLEMPRPPDMPALRFGLMEMSYTKHYSSSGSFSGGAAGADSGNIATTTSGSSTAAGACSGADITFTATTSASGSLLVGSSREFASLDSGNTAPPNIVDSIMQRAVQYIPGLAAVPQSEIHARAGPRPYATRGAPMVGPVPGMPGVFIAAGHEGSGLTLAPATAELLCENILSRPITLDTSVVEYLAVPTQSP